MDSGQHLDQLHCAKPIAFVLELGKNNGRGWHRRSMHLWGSAEHCCSSFLWSQGPIFLLART